MSQEKGAFGLELQMYENTCSKTTNTWSNSEIFSPPDDDIHVHMYTGTWQDSLGDLEPQYELQTTIFGDTLREKQVTSTPNRISVCLSDSHHNCQRQQTLFLFSFSSFVQFRLIWKGLRKGLI